MFPPRRTDKKRPTDPEATEIEAGVKVMGAPFDGFQDLGVPFR
jgi:hypothetical protein